MTESLNVHLKTKLRNTKTSEQFAQNKSTDSPMNTILNPNVHIMHVHDTFNDKVLVCGCRITTVRQPT
jgi:hypothetical protein